jgi:hypothetical protein
VLHAPRKHCCSNIAGTARGARTTRDSNSSARAGSDFRFALTVRNVAYRSRGFGLAYGVCDFGSEQPPEMAIEI